MSAIFGVYFFDGRPVEQSLLNAMGAAMKHRGPDGSGTWKNGPIGLGHLQMHTTPESLHEHLPMEGGSGQIVLTGDLRIDNREFLIPDLEFKGRPHAQIPDGEIVLAAYEKWGISLVDKLIGDYAFCIFDRQEQAIYLIRDHIGTRPIYFFSRPGKVFAFSTEIRGLFAVPGISQELNFELSADFILGNVSGDERTYFRDVQRMRESSWLKIQSDRIKEKRYWSLDPDFEVSAPSDVAYFEQFRDVFTKAVVCRLRTPFPIGSQLSGGLDSSAVTCVARDHLASEGRLPLTTFTNVFEKYPVCDERPFFEKIIQQPGISPVYVRAEEKGPLSDWREIMARHDQGFFGYNGFLIYAIMQSAKDRGIRTILDGFDGDSVVSHGVLRFREMAWTRDWSGLAREQGILEARFGSQARQAMLDQNVYPVLQARVQSFQWAGLMADIGQINRHFGVTKLHLIKRCLIGGFNGIRQIGRSNHSPIPGISALLTREFFEKSNFRERSRAAAEKKRVVHKTVRAEHAGIFNSGIAARIFERLDVDSAFYGLDSRHPFMDKRLVEFCVGLPARLKNAEGWTRYILRMGLRGVLPESISSRPGKTSMAPVFNNNLITLNQNELAQILGNKAMTSDRIIQRKNMQLAWHQCIENMRNDEETFLATFRLITEIAWLSSRDNRD